MKAVRIIVISTVALDLSLVRVLKGLKKPKFFALLCRSYHTFHSAFHLKIAGELKIDRSGTTRRAMHDQLQDRLQGV